MYSIFQEKININEISEREKDIGLQQYIVFTFIMSFKTFFHYNKKNFTDGASGTKAGSYDEVISGFPGFQIKDGVVDTGYLSFGGYMLGDTHKSIGK